MRSFFKKIWEHDFWRPFLTTFLCVSVVASIRYHAGYKQGYEDGKMDLYTEQQKRIIEYLQSSEYKAMIDYSERIKRAEDIINSLKGIKKDVQIIPKPFYPIQFSTFPNF